LIERGDVWLTRLDPAAGQEPQKTRPCLIVSPEEFTVYDLFIVVPMTTGSSPAPYRLPVRFNDRDGFLLPEQIRTVSRRRLQRKLGRLDGATVSRVLATLREMFED
jgi:mRNA interferase MazF